MTSPIKWQIKEVVVEGSSGVERLGIHPVEGQYLYKVLTRVIRKVRNETDNSIYSIELVVNSRQDNISKDLAGRIGYSEPLTLTPKITNTKSLGLRQTVRSFIETDKCKKLARDWEDFDDIEIAPKIS